MFAAAGRRIGALPIVAATAAGLGAVGLFTVRQGRQVDWGMRIAAAGGSWEAAGGMGGPASPHPSGSRPPVTIVAASPDRPFARDLVCHWCSLPPSADGQGRGFSPAICAGPQRL